MDNGINTIEFYSGDISDFPATSPNPSAVGGAQDNGPSSVTFAGPRRVLFNGRKGWAAMDFLPASTRWEQGRVFDSFRAITVA